MPGGEIHIGRPLIGFGGYASSGKDAAVDVLVEQGFKRTYMSKPLEQALLALNPQIVFEGNPSPNWMLYADLHAEVGYEASKRDPEVRRLLQRLGTEVGRKLFGENVWVDKMRTEVCEVLDAGGKIAVTGIRFRDEANAIRELGGRLVWVSRPGYGPVNGHSSDNTLGPDDFDEVIVNDGTLDDLRAIVQILSPRPGHACV